MNNLPPSYMPQIPPFPPQQSRNWWQRNWMWFVPTGCLSLLILVAVFAGAIVLFVFGLMKTSDVYKTAVGRAETNEQVIDALGTPISGKIYLSGSINVNGASGHADLTIPIRGPKGTGTIYVTATKSEDGWTYSKMNVHIDSSGESIDLLRPRIDIGGG